MTSKGGDGGRDRGRRADDGRRERHARPLLGLGDLLDQLDLLKEFGLHVLDIRALADERRPFTRRLGALVREAATTESGELRASGLRYDSRLLPRWEWWALWEPLPLNADEAEIQRVHIDTPGLRTAAQLLGVVLRD